MAKLKLTKTNIDKIAFCDKGKTADYWDTDQKGFGLRVGEQVKTFVIQVDVKRVMTEPGKKPYKTVKSIIGRYGEWTPEQARQEAGARIRNLREGEAAVSVTVPTLAEMLEIHLKDNSFKPLTEHAYRAELGAKFADWLNMSLADIAKIPADVIIDRLNKIKKDHSPIAAKNGFAKFQAVLNYARLKYPAAIPTNPCQVLSDGKLWPKVGARQDKIKGNDFMAFYQGIQGFNETTRDALLIAVYQGMRNREVAGLLWEYVDLEKKEIHIPAGKIKNNHALHVPLSKQSLAILTLRQERADKTNQFVFPAISDLSKTGHIAIRSDLLQLRTGLKVTVHGLRRSFVTIGKSLSLHEEAKRLVNHIDGTVTGKHYDGREVDDFRRPLQTIANEIERLMLHGVGAKVIQLAS